MSLRPRYSLLTLLVLTAFVAGGVKLWYGPHHVVESIKPGIEEEYTYTRNWRGEKVIQGVFVHRRNEYGIPGMNLYYYRQGKTVGWYYSAVAEPNELQDSPPPMQRIDSGLTEREWSEFRVAVKQEEQQRLPAGMHWHSREESISKLFD